MAGAEKGQAIMIEDWKGIDPGSSVNGNYIPRNQELVERGLDCLYEARRRRPLPLWRRVIWPFGKKQHLTSNPCIR